MRHFSLTVQIQLGQTKVSYIRVKGKDVITTAQKRLGQKV